MSAGLLIRDATKDDIDLLADLHLKSHEQNYKYFMPENYFKAINKERFLRFWIRAFDNDLYKNKIWIAEVDGKPAGFCNVELAHYYPAAYAGHLDTLHLLKEHTGKGFGKIMFELSKNYFFETLKVSGFHLVVYDRHEKAKRFYESLGGQELDFKKLNVIDRQSAFIYTSYGWKR